MNKLTQQQISKIESSMIAYGFGGSVTEYGASLDSSGYQKLGARVEIYVGEKYGAGLSVEMGHSSMGGKTIAEAEASVKTLIKGIKLAKKIKGILR